MAKVTRIPLRRAAQIAGLDKEDVIEGYYDGRNNMPEPGNNRSFSYWHGWRNGMVDAGHRGMDDAQLELSADIHRECQAGRNPFSYQTSQVR
jgi:hypothetical protein